MGLTFRLERADDGVVLAVELTDLTPTPRLDGWVLTPGPAARITVSYGPQHIVEYADKPTQLAPLQEAPIFAPDTRVVYAVPAAFSPIRLSVEGILGALPNLALVGGSHSLPMHTVPDPQGLAAQARTAAGTAARRQQLAAARAAASPDAVATVSTPRAGAAAAVGEAGATSVFVPSRLELAVPSGSARFVHSARPAQRGDLVESWHSRFAVRTTSADGRPVEIATVAVVRSGVDYATPPAGTEANDRYRRIVDEKKINSALDDSVDDLVTVTRTTPLTMRRLHLSPLGGTVDLEGTWSKADGTWPGPIGSPPPEPSLKAYRHRVLLGRDVEIRKVLRGTLYPLGHPAILVETTRRRARALAQGTAAALITQTVITVRKPTMTYSHNDARGRSWPWSQVRILNPISPPGVDTTHSGLGVTLHYLMVDGEPFLSECRAVDLGGNEVTFSLAQVFVPDNTNLSVAGFAWASLADPTKPFGDRFVGFELAGRSVAVAPPPSISATADANADVTTLNVRKVSFNRFAPGVAGAGPQIAEFVATSPVVDGLRGSTEAVFRYATPYLNSGFGGANAGELLMDVQTGTAKLGQQAAGLVKAETAEIRALSRRLGAVAAQAVPGKDVAKVLTDLAGGSFDPAAWFKLPDAKLFGVFPLQQVLARAGSTISQLERAPKQLVEVVNGTKKVTVSWQTILLAKNEELPALPLPVTLGTVAGTSMDLDLFNSTEVDLATSTVRTTNRCTITNAALKIGPPPVGNERHLVTLPIPTMRFESTDTGAPDVDLRVGTVEFGGALAFVATLAELLASTGLGKPERAPQIADRTAAGGRRTELAAAAAAPSGPSVEVIGDTIRAGLSVGLPDVAVGVFSLQDLAFASFFDLSVSGTAPPTLSLHFATIDNPFRLTVSLIGGGGHLLVRLSTAGLVLVAGALEFGAAIAVNLAGVAQGSASVMGGLYYELIGGDVTLTGYLSMKGKLSILGLISVAVEVNLSLTYVTGTGKVEGAAELVIKFKVLWFKKTVRFEVKKQFAGANADPTFAQIMAPADWPDRDKLPWDIYCTAFAAA